MSRAYCKTRSLVTGALGVVAAMACDVPARAPVAPPMPASVTPAIALERPAPAAPETAPSNWKSFDEVPPGASFRLGSRAWQGEGVLAISDEGTIATVHRGLGLVEIRADGMFRVVDARLNPLALRYVGGALIGASYESVQRWEGTAVTKLPFKCSSSRPVAISARGERLACFSNDADQHETIEVLDLTTSKPAWRVKVPKDASELAVSDAGVVFASDGASYVEAIEGGETVWRAAGKLEDPAYEPTRDEVVVWNGADERFDVLRAQDGVRVRRTPAASHSLRGPIAIAPDGGSWLAVASDQPSILTRWDAKTGAVLGAWPIGTYAYGAAVSPNGRFAAAISDRIVRVDLVSGVASAKVSDPASEPTSLTSSRSGARLVLVDSDELVRVFDARSGKEVVRGPAPEAILRDVPVAFAPDDASFVVANAYGDLRILDTFTLREKCRTDDVPATWLYWSGKHIVAVYLGNPADDEQYTGGTVTVVDASCKVKKIKEHPGLIYLAADDDQTLDLIFEAYERPPYGGHPASYPSAKTARAMRVVYASGTIAAAPVGVLERARAKEKELERANDEGQERATSIDERTIAVAMDDGDRRTLTCRDASSNAVLVEHVLPTTAWQGIAIAGDGSWVATPEGSSVLMYPCRKAEH